MEKKDSSEGRTKQKRLRHKTNTNPKYKIAELLEELKQKGSLPIEEMKKILNQSSPILQNQPNMLKLRSPIIIVGDIHGQFFDLLNIFQKFGDMPNEHYLFLGDYVDRGKFCIEVMTLILMLKINYPDHIHLLRGNHEGRTMTTFFNFKIQCEKKYHSAIYDQFIDVFMKLPLCALIDSKYFAVHGGLSPHVKSIADIEKINRFVEIPEQGPLCDLLWSDPLDESHENWLANKMRSCSYYYSRSQTMKFLNTNNVKMIIRGHEVQMKGFKYQYSSENQPLTLTIFSAPKYCDSYKNKGAIAVLSGKDIAIKSFKEVEHPFVLNHYLNAFDLSFPMIAMGVTKIFTHILKNPKVRKSLRPSEEVDIIQILKKIENVSEISQVLNINADQINLLLASTRPNANFVDEEISQGFLDFIEQKCKEANEKLPTIFGPKGLEFVKIKIGSNEQEFDPMDETQ